MAFTIRTHAEKPSTSPWSNTGSAGFAAMTMKPFFIDCRYQTGLNLSWTFLDDVSRCLRNPYLLHASRSLVRSGRAIQSRLTFFHSSCLKNTLPNGWERAARRPSGGIRRNSSKPTADRAGSSLPVSERAQASVHLIAIARLLAFQFVDRVRDPHPCRTALQAQRP